MTETLFAALNVYHDISSRSAAMNMAIDEALLEVADVPSIRFYRWDSPALSFGYFGRFADVATYIAERDLVRRWTGGGIVFHGDDLTYAIVIPANDPLFGETSLSIYEKVHRGLADVLNGAGERAKLVGSARCADRTPQRGVPTTNCFANPVDGDVILDGRKIAGAAQRRTRCGLLHQGSIQLAIGRVRPHGGHVDLANGLADRFAQALSQNCQPRKLSRGLLEQAEEIAAQKYAAGAWLRKR